MRPRGRQANVKMGLGQHKYDGSIAKERGELDGRKQQRTSIVMWSDDGPLRRNLSLPVTISTSFSFSLCVPFRPVSRPRAHRERDAILSPLCMEVRHRVAHKRRPLDSSLRQDVPTREEENDPDPAPVFHFLSRFPFGTSGLDTLRR